MYIYPTDLKLNNTSELLTEIPQNRYIKCYWIITLKDSNCATSSTYNLQTRLTRIPTGI
jgi:hypothetical protein